MECSHCKGMFHFSKISRRQRLCETCKNDHAPVICRYCSIHFHTFNGSSSKESACQHCEPLASKYGSPKECSICQNLACFGSDTLCKHCGSSQKKYGQPKQCKSCGIVRAFKKSKNPSFPNGDLICLTCTSSDVVKHAEKRNRGVFIVRNDLHTHTKAISEKEKTPRTHKHTANRG